MLSTRQAATRLGVTQRQVLRFVEAGLLHAQQLDSYPNAPWLIDEASLDQLITARSTKPPRRGRRPAGPTLERIVS
jgi:Helix-turn-helix domain